MASSGFWERPDVVERFGEREPDRRLVAWLQQHRRDGLRALDLGCAAGRNCALLAEAGVELWAIDGSAAMVEATRARLTPAIGAHEAARRVLHGTMDDLGAFGEGDFDLVVALGVLQNAATAAEWERTLSEVARVLAPGGVCLVANFAPDSRPSGEPLEPVEGEANVYRGFGGPHQRITLLTAEALDRAFARHGLEPAEPTRSVHVPTERGHRTTVNALYRRRG